MSSAMPHTTRFAPSPTNNLHLGHAFSAWFAWAAADVAGGGRFLVRIEDIDRDRSRDEFISSQLADLAWLGLAHETPVLRQSDRMDAYGEALARLQAAGAVYPCFCSRKDIQREIEESGRAPHLDGMGAPIYPGTCRHLSGADRAARIAAGEEHAWRLDAGKAVDLTGALTWQEESLGPMAVKPEIMGDVVLARRDLATSYHLAVVVDDAFQGVTLVTRGRDLFPATHVHRPLQALLGLPVPAYHHHDLVTGPDGRRLAKRDGAATLREMRAGGASPADVWDRLGIAEGERPPVSKGAGT